MHRRREYEKGVRGMKNISASLRTCGNTRTNYSSRGGLRKLADPFENVSIPGYRERRCNETRLRVAPIIHAAPMGVGKKIEKILYRARLRASEL